MNVALCRLMDEVADDVLERRIAAAEPEEDDLDRDWVKARAATALFSVAQEPPSIGRFKLGDRLGAGGMGLVYAAHDPDLDREVAVKLVRVARTAERDETLAEAQALARLSHPNVVAIHDVGVRDDQVFMVMEYVRGQTLRAYAGDDGRTAHELASAYRQAAEGLAAAHRAGLVHRDFKPDNAVIGDDGRVRVIDFGLAHENDTTSERPTAGTPRYMAPEQARGEALAPAADQYALCVSLREAIHSACGDLAPGWIDSIIDRGTAEDISDRFDDLDEVAQALAMDPAITRRRRLLFGGAVAAAAATFAIGASVFAGGGKAADACAGGDEIIDSAWSPEARSAEFRRIGDLGDYGASLVPSLTSRAASFVGGWTNVHRQACISHERGEQSAELLDQQMACLYRQQSAWRTFGKITEAADSSSLASLANVVIALPAPEQCSDIAELLAIAPPPAEKRLEAREIGDQLAAIKVVAAAGRLEEALRSIHALSDRTRALEYPPLLAEVLLLKGHVALQMRLGDEARKSLAEATKVALRSELDSIAVESWARRAWLEAIVLDQQQPTQSETEMIEALASRSPKSFATALFYNNLSSLLISKGDRNSAREALVKASEAAAFVEGPGALELAFIGTNLAILTSNNERRDQLASQTVETFTRLLGVDHPRTFEATVSRARLFLEPNPGFQLLKRTCSKFAEVHPALTVPIGHCFFEMAWLAEQAGQREAAMTAMEMAARHPDPGLLVTAGLAAALRGDSTVAVKLLDPLVTKSRPLTGDIWWQQLRLAELEMALGFARKQAKVAEANVMLESAIGRLTSIKQPAPVVKRRLALARQWLAE